MGGLRSINPPPALSDQDTAAWRLLEADLVSGAIELADLATHGIPPARAAHFTETPAAILERLLLAVEPEDLTRMGGGIWVRTRRAWNLHHRLSWDLIASGAPQATRRTIDFYRTYGMGIGLQAPVAAERLLNLRAAFVAHAQALDSAAAALQNASDAVRSVVGVQ